MGGLWYLLIAVLAGIISGVIIVLFKRATAGVSKNQSVSRLKTVEKRWYKFAEDLKLVKDLGTDLKDQFPEATPERVEKVKELARKFEGAWFRSKDESTTTHTSTNMMETMTTYEFERIIDKLEENLNKIFGKNN